MTSGPMNPGLPSPKAKPGFHSVTAASLVRPSVSNDSEGKAREHAWGTNNRNFQRPRRRTLPEHYSTRGVCHRLKDALEPIAAKDLADASGSSVRAAENAKMGLNAMSLAHFLNACREIPELRALAMEMMGCETTIDPEFQRGLAMLANSIARQQAAGSGA